MAAGSHVPANAIDAASILEGPQGVGVTLRPVRRTGMGSETSGSFSGPPSQLSGRGFTENAAAGFSLPRQDYSKPVPDVHAQTYLEDGLGAMRGLMLIVGLYMVMGVLGVGGLLIWHWMH
jgi:hypothetical protein